MEPDNETYGFDAIRGIQAGREYFVVICPLKIIPKLFIFNEYDLPAELRSQRILKKSRIPELKDYILNNPDEYIFTSLAASVDGDIKFIPASHLGPDGKLGRLYINMDARLVINDGQHRRKAIEEALKQKPELGHETISVVFFEDHGLNRSQQMFADLNKNAIKPSKSLNILYDKRDAYSQFIVEITKSIEIFKGRVEMEKTSIGRNGKEMFTLGGISDATKKLLGRNKILRLNKEEKKLAEDFWTCVSVNIPEWQMIINGGMSPDELRANYVNGHTNCLNAIGLAGNVIVKKHPNDWKKVLSILKKIKWSRDNDVWKGRFLQGGQMVRTSTGMLLGANAILKTCGVPLTPEMQKQENKFD